MHKSFIYPAIYNRIRIRSRGYLPHWELDGAVYSVTYRLGDSLPPRVTARLAEERRAIIQSITDDSREPTLVERAEIDHLYLVRLDHYLDQGYGACHLRSPNAASIVKGTLQFHDAARYDLIAWCVMPNHVHVVLELHRGEDLSRMFHSWKSYSSNQINRRLGLRGQLWQREYFDRIVRDHEDLKESVRYVLDNPLKAGLRDWPWVWVNEAFDPR